MAVPLLRRRQMNDSPVDRSRELVLYWMIANRRVAWNFALDRAVEWAIELDRPLVVLEALRCDYPYASDRLHRFVLDGMAENARRLARAGVLYHPYVEPRRGAGRGLLAALAAHACVVVTDDFPAFFLPRMVAAAARRFPVRLEAVDSNGLLPLRAADRAFPTAFGFRRFLQKTLPDHLGERPKRNPFSRNRPPRLRELPRAVTKRWPVASRGLLEGRGEELASLPIDHTVAPTALRGGSAEAARRWKAFLRRGLDRYADDRNHPDENATSGLSPWLHFGHVSTHEIFASLARREGWKAGDQAARVTGKTRGWWRMGEGAEAFLDQLVTWRELGFNFCAHRADHDRYDSLPDWARKTLAKHRRDRRVEIYSLRELREARTADPLWNAAQRELRVDGRIHNYLRMLWGKKVLEWSPDPQTAIARLLELNDRYALDGRDPNSYSGVFWIFGRYDRAWGPERPIFGTIRYMSSASARRKLRLESYLRRYGTGS